MSSIPEALPTPRHTIRRTDIESKPIVDKRAAMEIFIAVLVGWLVLARRLRAGYFFAGGGAGMGSVS